MWQNEQQICLEATRQTISDRLRTEYEVVVPEPLPELLNALLEELEEAEAASTER